MPRNGPLNSRCTLHTIKRKRWAELGWMRRRLPFLLRVFKINGLPLHWCRLSGLCCRYGVRLRFRCFTPPSLFWIPLTTNIPVYSVRCFPTGKTRSRINLEFTLTIRGKWAKRAKKDVRKILGFSSEEPCYTLNVEIRRSLECTELRMRKVLKKKRGFPDKGLGKGLITSKWYCKS